MYVDGEKGTGTKVELDPTQSYAAVPLTANQSHAGMSAPAHVSGNHGFSWIIDPTYSRSQFYLYALEPGDPAEYRLLPGSPKTPTWPSGRQPINARDGDPDQNDNPQRIAISVNNNEQDKPPTNYPVHPNLKAAVDTVLAAMHTNNTTPAITSVNINSTLRGNSARHSQGRAADINEINGLKVKCAHADFATNSACTGQGVIGNMKKWVKALQDAFLNDCRVNQVLGPVRNRNKWAHKKTGKNPHDVTDDDTIEKHKDHIHINVLSQVRTCP